MNSFVAGLVFLLSITFVFAVPAAVSSDTVNKTRQASDGCNATKAIQQIILSIAAGQRVKLTEEDKCHVNCFLKAVRFFDENSDLRGQGLVNATLRQYPEAAKYSDVLIAKVFQLSRSTKGYDDKCQKAFVAFHQYATSIFELAIASDIEKATGVKNEIVDYVENGKPISQDLVKKLELLTGALDKISTSMAQELQKEVGLKGIRSGGY
ncbi:uncharacterized protein LOC135838553 [Planococcus citri]|uniref:uncharacterized protein LOC135838553 n=1 Tax=Planococcus citri TaxID=170843 RepID=UPI0031F8FE6B